MRRLAIPALLALMLGAALARAAPTPSPPEPLHIEADNVTGSHGPSVFPNHSARSSVVSATL